jgi:S-DNA-T family DNA segregation ATPase FtsK/SpoIIIE
MSKPIRVQSAHISENEVKNVTKFLADNYFDAIPQKINFSNEDRGNGILSASLDADGDREDDLYEEARLFVIEAKRASASYLQRKLRVGYARAARLLDMLEERGVIGPGDGAKPREVYGTGDFSESQSPESEYGQNS